MTPSTFMVATTCLSLLSLAGYRVGYNFAVASVEPYPVQLARQAAHRRATDGSLAGSKVRTPLSSAAVILARVFVYDDYQHEIGGCEHTPAKLDSSPTAIVLAAAKSDEPYDEQYFEAGSCELSGRRPNSSSVAPEAEWCGQVADAVDQAPPAWILSQPATNGDGTCEEDGDALAAEIVEVADHGAQIGFDPIAELKFAGAPEARSRRDRGAVFEAFLADQADEHTVSYERQITHQIRSGETLSQVLDSAGVVPAEVNRWLDAANEHYDLNRIYAGQAFSASVDMRSSTLSKVALQIDRHNVLVATREDDTFIVRREKIPYKRNVRVVESEIKSSLYMAAVGQGLPDRIISQMAEILGWEIDFARDIRPGAHFRVVYEELTRLDDSSTIPGRVLATEVTNRNKRHEAFYFDTAEHAEGTHYKRDGEGLGRYFLRYPVEFTRISSRFSERRFHPVLKSNRPHYGVDFAAPTGTPVKALAGGTIETAGWQGGNGRFVKIRHDGVYESGYAHLSRIEKGLKPGATVKKGQIIGYVGSTGLATGPHLHLALYRDGKYIDPLTSELPHAPALDNAALALFEATVEAIELAYARDPGAEERLASLASAGASD